MDTQRLIEQASIDQAAAEQARAAAARIRQGTEDDERTHLETLRKIQETIRIDRETTRLYLEAITIELQAAEQARAELRALQHRGFWSRVCCL